MVECLSTEPTIRVQVRALQKIAKFFFYKLRTKISLSPEQRFPCLLTKSQQTCKRIGAIVDVTYYGCKEIARILDTNKEDNKNYIVFRYHV